MGPFALLVPGYKISLTRDLIQRSTIRDNLHNGWTDMGEEGEEEWKSQASSGTKKPFAFIQKNFTTKKYGKAKKWGRHSLSLYAKKLLTGKSKTRIPFGKRRKELSEIRIPFLSGSSLTAATASAALHSCHTISAKKWWAAGGRGNKQCVEKFQFRFLLYNHGGRAAKQPTLAVVRSQQKRVVAEMKGLNCGKYRFPEGFRNFCFPGFRESNTPRVGRGTRHEHV